MSHRVQTLKEAAAQAAAMVLVLTVTALTVTGSQEPRFFQERFRTGQTVAPSYEGWEQNPDGSFNLLFGYFNRNWEEQTHVPIGPANTIEPGGPDQGQPTRFLPRRNKFIFKVWVPRDFGNKEVVWSLTTQGKTERAYATLKPDYKIDKRVYMTNMHMHTQLPEYSEFDQDMADDVAPVVRLEGAPQRTVKVGEPLSLNAFVSDDGKLKVLPVPKGANNTDETALGLRVAWYVYRGGGRVTFEPEQFTVWQDKNPGGNSPWTPGWAPPPLPADGMHPVKITFEQPGNYTMRLLAHDGGLQTHTDVVVNVTAAQSTAASAP